MINKLAGQNFTNINFKGYFKKPSQSTPVQCGQLYIDVDASAKIRATIDNAKPSDIIELNAAEYEHEQGLMKFRVKDAQYLQHCLGIPRHTPGIATITSDPDKIKFEYKLENGQVASWERKPTEGAEINDIHEGVNICLGTDFKSGEPTPTDYKNYFTYQREDFLISLLSQQKKLDNQ